MSRIATLLLVSLLCAASPAAGQGGVGLYWDGCSADAHAEVKSFTCDANTGDAFSLFATVAVPAEMPTFAAATVIVDIWYWYYAPVPEWWKTAAGQCRANAISVTFDPSEVATAGCPDLWQGNVPLSVFQTQAIHDGQVLRITGQAAVMAGTELHLLPDGSELNVGRIRISREKSAGAGSCAGCEVCARLMIAQVKLQQPAGAGDYTVTSSISYGSNEVFWNGYCPPPDAVQHRSWGAVKGLYR